MMLYPPVAELVEKVGSRYQLVNLVARRARALSITKEGEIPSDRKPVSEAIDEVYTGRLTIVNDGESLHKTASLSDGHKPAEVASASTKTETDENPAAFSGAAEQNSAEG